MYTYNRVDDARINMEIIRSIWSKIPLFKDLVLVHAYNGDKSWWPEKYLEDELLYLENSGHFTGAELLLNEGVKVFSEKYSDVDYVITLAPDTWCLKPEYLEKIIISMQKEEKYLATCAWGTKEKDNMFNIGMALDLNIFNLKWATQYKLFPLRFTEFVEKYSEVFYYDDRIIFLERVFALRFRQAVVRSLNLPSENLEKKAVKMFIHRMVEREPVHIDKQSWFNRKGRKMYWSKIGLVTYHEPEPKKAIIKNLKVSIGKHADRLISSKDLSYYNGGHTLTTFKKGESKVNYGD